MKHVEKAIIFIIVLVIPLLLSGVIPPVYMEAEILSSENPTKVNSLSYETHTPISILNDSMFNDIASSEEWAGEGSPSLPYIIEGYNITSDTTCIHIQDVTLSFEIRSCYITSITPWSAIGITVYNSSLISITDTIIEGKTEGIVLEMLFSPLILNCEFTNNSAENILGINSVGTEIDSCNFHDSNGHGIYLDECNESVITNSEIVNIDGPGIFVYNAEFVTILQNEISDCSHRGIWVLVSPYITIEENIFHNNLYISDASGAIHLADSPHAAIVGNEIYDNARNGIYLTSSDWAYIFDNDISGNSDHGIDSIASNNGTILQNNIHGNGWWPVISNALCGIYLGSSVDWLISDNSLWNNTPSGISLENVERIEICNNEIFNNTDAGIYGVSSSPITGVYILQNRIYGNGYYASSPYYQAGILLLNGILECVIEDNEVYNNTYSGIFFYGNYNTIRNNHVYGNKLAGIHTEECYYNLISENIAYDNEYGIYVVNVGTNVTGNIVYDNEYGIYMEYSGDCFIYGNDVGWNEINAFESDTFAGQPLYWHDNVSTGNWWHNYNYTGYYNISSDSGDDNVDLCPAKSLDLVPPSAIDFEILETGNTLVWHAYALHPDHYEVFIDSVSVLTHVWDGGDIEVNVDGLTAGAHTIELIVYHLSGHFMGNSSAANVDDLTPPVIDGSEIIEAVPGGAISVQYTATDPSGIDLWAVNDTVNFQISSTGLLTNIGTLQAGNYTILISVTDSFGNNASMVVTIVVRTTGGLPSTLVLAIGTGAAAVLLVIILIIYKRRGT